MRAALKNRQLRHLVHDGGAHLHATGTGANQAHPLALDGGAVVPTGGMEMGPLKVAQAGQVGDGGDVELAHRADQHLGLDVAELAIGPAHLHPPQFVGLDPMRGGHLGAKTHMAADVKAVGAVFEVLPNFVARRKVTRPAVVGRKRVLVKVVRRVHAATGVAVLQPGAPH